MSAARYIFRSAASRATAAAARLNAGPKTVPRPSRFPFGISRQSPLSNRIFRAPVEMSFCVETMLPYHTATASALLTSILSVSCRTSGWTLDATEATISTRLVCLYFPIFTYLFLSAFTIARSDELFHFCAANASFITNSTYHANLNRLLSTLSSDIQNDSSFYNVSYGQNSDQVNAIALCRGDVKAEVCRSCITNSTEELKQECPNQKAAIVWHDECMLRYSNRSIFGKMRTGPSVCMSSLNNASNANQFDQVVTTLLDNLTSRAASGGSLLKFGTGNAKISESETVYALVQCTPDISKAECSNCLSNATALIPQCSQGKLGGRILAPSCNFRYENYLFYNTSSDVQPPSLPPASPLSLPPASPPTASPPPLGNTATRKGIMRSRLQILIALTAPLFCFQYLGF